MNTGEKMTVDRAIRFAKPADLIVEAVSSVGGTKAISDAIKAIEASAARFQKSGSEVLLIAVRR